MLANERPACNAPTGSPTPIVRRRERDTDLGSAGSVYRVMVSPRCGKPALVSDHGKHRCVDHLRVA